MSIITILNKDKNTSIMRRDKYISLALVYGMLKLVELYKCYNFDVHKDHPPIFLREFFIEYALSQVGYK